MCSLGSDFTQCPGGMNSRSGKNDSYTILKSISLMNSGNYISALLFCLVPKEFLIYKKTQGRLKVFHLKTETSQEYIMTSNRASRVSS